MNADTLLTNEKNSKSTGYNNGACGLKKGEEYEQEKMDETYNGVHGCRYIGVGW